MIWHRTLVRIKDACKIKIPYVKKEKKESLATQAFVLRLLLIYKRIITLKNHNLNAHKRHSDF